MISMNRRFVLAPRPEGNIFERTWKVNVGGFEVWPPLRVGFTVERSLELTANTAEIVLYNLNPWSRKRLADARDVPVYIRAGYRRFVPNEPDAANYEMVLFAGEMREAFSRAEPDGTWATVLRAGDGDKATTEKRNSLAVRPGVSLERVLQEQLRVLGVGMGNAVTEISKQLQRGDNLDAQMLQQVFTQLGTNAVGNSAKIAQRLLDRAGMEVSIQNGKIQILGKGQMLGTRAVVLHPDNGLEGVPEVDRHGELRCRARLLPGLTPGAPLQVIHAGSRTARAPAELYSLSDYNRVYRIEKVRYVGDTHGRDWNAEIEARDVRAAPKEKKKARRK